MHDHGRTLHDHDSDREFHKHSGSTYHEHETGHYFRKDGDQLIDRGHRSRDSHRHSSGWPYDPYYDYGYRSWYYDPYYDDGIYIGAGGIAIGISPYGTRYSIGAYTTSPDLHLHYETAPPAAITPAPPAAVDEAAEEPAASLSGAELYEMGVRTFRKSDYEAAERWLRHSAARLPDNGQVWMVLSQALFARKSFDESAGALQRGMALVAPELWGTVVANHRNYYDSPQDYVDQLKALEQAVRDDPASPGLRLLLAFHYGWLGYPKESVREAGELLKLAPQDALGKKLRDLMSFRITAAPSEPAPKAAAEKPAGPDEK